MNVEPSRMFRAFSDPLRLRILHLLRDEDTCVGDLVQVLGVPQPTASRHLRYLRRARLVSVRTNGRWKFYRLAPAETAFHRRLLECLGACFREIPELQEDLTNAMRLRNTGGCCPSQPKKATANSGRGGPGA